MRTRFFIFLFSSLFVFSCSRDLETHDVKPISSKEIDRLSFGSIEEFRNAMITSSHGDTKSSTIRQPRVNLFTKTNQIEIENDPVLCHDLKGYTATKAAEDVSVYEAAGYEELIPDETLAGFLNARAEVEIANTVYKISPQGTYFFDKELEDDFYENYSTFEEEEGVLIDTLTVKLLDGIYRYNTFRIDDHTTYYSEDYYEEEDEEIDYCEVETKAPTIVSSLQNLNYSKFPRYCSDAQTQLGKIFQSIFGRNKSFDYNFTNKQRFTSKFYYYDYLFWSSIGICTKTQKKSFLVWKEATADEIYIGWSDIITKTKLKGNILEYPSKAKTVTIKKTEYNNTLKKNEEVLYIFGLSVSQSDIDKAIGLGVKSLLSVIKSKTGTDASSADKICVAGPQYYYTVYPSDGDRELNVKKLDKVFYREFSLGVTFDALNLPSDWKAWAMSILKTTYELPNTELYQGEARTAVRFNGQTGALSIYKKP